MKGYSSVKEYLDEVWEKYPHGKFKKEMALMTKGSKSKKLVSYRVTAVAFKPTEVERMSTDTICSDGNTKHLDETHYELAKKLFNKHGNDITVKRKVEVL